MSQNITIAGASFPDVPAIQCNKTGGGTASFVDTSDANATAADIAQNKTAYVNGQKVTGNAQGSNDFIVTIDYDSNNDIWVPDCTLAEIQAAYAAGKTIAVVNAYADSGASSDGWYQDYNQVFLYTVCAWYDDVFKTIVYCLDSNGVDVDEALDLIHPYFETVSKVYTPTTSQQTEAITFDTGNDYNGLQQVNVTVNAVPSAELTGAPERVFITPEIELNTGTGEISTQDVHVGTIQPIAVAGLIETSQNIPVQVETANTKQLPVQAAQTIYPSSNDQVINSGKYLTGNQTIKGVLLTNLLAANIKQGVTVEVGDSADTDRIASVTGTYSGGGGSGLTLLKTTALGTLSTSSTSATDTGKSMTVTGYNDYDLLIVDVSVDSVVNGRHTSTVSIVLLTGTSNVTTKNTYTVGSNKWNSKRSSSGTGSTRQSTSAYGVYVNAATVNNDTMTLTFYYRYNSNSTGTLNGTYTARVYGVKLYDLIGG